MSRPAPDRPAVLVLASTFPAHPDDGTPAFVLDLAREEAREFEVTVLTPRVPGSASEEVIDGVRVVRYPYFFRRWEDLASGAILDNLKAKRSRWLQVLPLVAAQRAAIRREVARIAPDAIHAHWLIPQGLLATSAAASVPLLVTLHGGDVYALRGSIPTALKRRTARRAAAVSVVNPQMREIVAGWGVEGDAVDVVPMGVAMSDVAATERRPRTPHSIVAVGRLVEKKGFAILLDALRDHVDVAGWTLTIVGDGPLRSQLERRAEGLPVRFLGQQGRATVLAELARAEVFALPSVPAQSGDQEGLPVTLLEAAALGSAIVASELPGITEVVDGNTTGLLAPPGDVAALGAQLTRLLTDGALRKRVGAGAATRAQEFTTEAIGARYRELLRRTIAAQPPSNPRR